MNHELYAAISDGDIDAVQVLLAAGADTTIQNNNGLTPLQ